MSAMPQPSGVPAATTSSESFTTTKRSAIDCSLTQDESCASSSGAVDAGEPEAGRGDARVRQVLPSGSRPVALISAPSIAIATALSAVSKPTPWGLLPGPKPRPTFLPSRSVTGAWVFEPPPSTASRNLGRRSVHRPSREAQRPRQGRLLAPRGRAFAVVPRAAPRLPGARLFPGVRAVGFGATRPDPADPLGGASPRTSNRKRDGIVARARAVLRALCAASVSVSVASRA